MCLSYFSFCDRLAYRLTCPRFKYWYGDIAILKIKMILDSILYIPLVMYNYNYGPKYLLFYTFLYTRLLYIKYAYCCICYYISIEKHHFYAVFLHICIFTNESYIISNIIPRECVFSVFPKIT